ncbi:MAG: hypothetical protein WC475_02970 [Candidatus Paceibacterota bacterium]
MKKSYSAKYYNLLRSFLYKYNNPEKPVSETGNIKTGRTETYYFIDSKVCINIQSIDHKSRLEIEVFSEDENTLEKIFRKLDNQIKSCNSSC